jgi:hypothetical protein
MDKCCDCNEIIERCNIIPYSEQCINCYVEENDNMCPNEKPSEKPKKFKIKKGDIVENNKNK